MRTLTKEQAISLVLDKVKTTCRKTKLDFLSLKEMGYISVSEIAGLNVPSHYLFSEKEGRLFHCTMAGCTEVIKAVAKKEGLELF